MKSIIEFCAVFAVSILNHLIGAFFYSKRADYPKSFTVTENLLRYWGGSISAILVVLLVAIDQPDGFASIGIPVSSNTAKTNSTTLLILFLSFFLLMFLMAGIQKIVHYFSKKTPETNIDLSNPAIVSVNQFRDAFELLAYLTVLPLIVISEELVYRGYLVLMLGNKTHTFIPWIILSIILSVAIHLYQGRNIINIVYHAIFATFFIGLTITTGNILAPITIHLIYNIVWTVQTWNKVKKQEIQPEISHSKKKRFAYSVFIGFNILLLYVPFQLISYAR
jgi:membrane protease YdiL (CAAX protease family)